MIRLFRNAVKTLGILYILSRHGVTVHVIYVPLLSYGHQ